MSLTSWLNRIRTELLPSRPRCRRRRQAALHTSSERLESREVFSVTASVAARTLLLQGDGANDNVKVTVSNGQFVVSQGATLSQVSRYSTAGIDRIEFRGNDGNDTFENATSYACTALGGNGNDILRGGSGLDKLYGESGVDTLTGVVGEDLLEGGSGNDTINVTIKLQDAFSNFGSLPKIYGTDTFVVSLDVKTVVDSVIAPAIRQINAATAKIDPLLAKLDTQVPVLSYFKSYTFRDLITSGGSSITKFVSAVSALKSFDTSRLPKTTVSVGTFQISENVWNLRFPATKSLSSAYAGLANNAMVKQLSSIGVSIPLLTDAKSVVDVMLGRNVDLVRYTLPDLNASVDFSKSFSIPLVSWLSANVEVSLGFAFHAGGTFVIDTMGLRTGRVMDGFYMQNVGAEFSATIGGDAGGSLSVGGLKLGSAGLRGTGKATISFSLNDPNGDGKVRLNEIGSLSSAVKTTGSLDFKVYVYVQVADPVKSIFSGKLKYAEYTRTLY